MQFWITFRTGFRDAHYLVEHLVVNKREEQFTIIARNGSVTFSSNRPLFRNKGLRKRKPDYVLIDGSIPNKSTERQLVEAIQNYVERNWEGLLPASQLAWRQVRHAGEENPRVSLPVIKQDSRAKNPYLQWLESLLTSINLKLTNQKT